MLPEIASQQLVLVLDLLGLGQGRRGQSQLPVVHQTLDETPYRGRRQVRGRIFAYRSG
jgi:hypothetical protein